jgi:hypothetical protein
MRKALKPYKFTTVVGFFTVPQINVHMKNTFEQMGLRSLADVLFNLIHMLNHMARHLPTNGNRQQAVCECNAEFLCLSGAIPGQLEVERRPESGFYNGLA